LLNKIQLVIRLAVRRLTGAYENVCVVATVVSKPVARVVVRRVEIAVGVPGKIIRIPHSRSMRLDIACLLGIRGAAVAIKEEIHLSTAVVEACPTTIAIRHNPCHIRWLNCFPRRYTGTRQARNRNHCSDDQKKMRQARYEIFVRRISRAAISAEGAGYFAVKRRVIVIRVG